MWAAVKLFFSDNMAKLIEWLAIIGAAATAILAIFNAGKKSEKVDELKTVMKESADARKIEDTNRAELHDGDAADKLRSDWSR